MSNRAFSRFRLISIALFVLGLVSATVAFSLYQANGKKLRHRKGFTLITQDWAVPVNPPPDGPKIITHSVSTRHQKSDGTWKNIRRYYNSKNEIVKKDISFGIPGQGVFKINMGNHELEFVSSMLPLEKTSYVPISDGHDQPNFVRDDFVNGYQTYVLRFPDEDGGYVDIYYAPELDGTPVREVVVSPMGVEISEMVKIKFGDPDDKVFEGAPKWVVNYNFFKQKIASMDEAGKHEAAEGLRKELAEQIAKQDREQ